MIGGNIKDRLQSMSRTRSQVDASPYTLAELRELGHYLLMNGPHNLDPIIMSPMSSTSAVMMRVRELSFWQRYQRFLRYLSDVEE